MSSTGRKTCHEGRRLRGLRRQIYQILAFPPIFAISAPSARLNYVFEAFHDRTGNNQTASELAHEQGRHAGVTGSVPPSTLSVVRR